MRLTNQVCAGLLTWTSTVSRGANFVVLFKKWLIKRSMITSKGHRYPDLYVSQQQKSAGLAQLSIPCNVSSSLK